MLICYLVCRSETWRSHDSRSDQSEHTQQAVSLRDPVCQHHWLKQRFPITFDRRNSRGKVGVRVSAWFTDCNAVAVTDAVCVPAILIEGVSYKNVICRKRTVRGNCTSQCLKLQLLSESITIVVSDLVAENAQPLATLDFGGTID